MELDADAVEKAAQTEWPYQTRVHKKRDGLMVIYGPWIVDFMHWHEGLQWRLTGKLPKRILSARAALLRAGE